jgi:thiamine transport system ATP-binding protein
VLTFENVVYETGTFRLDANLTIKDGARVGLIGPSGAGKSTLLDLATGFRKPQQGRILWNGRDITQMPPSKRPFAMLFQDHNLFPHLSVGRNLGLALNPQGGKSTWAERVQIEDALSNVGLGGYIDRKPGTLSGGQQSRAALARVMLQDKPALCLDEPFAALGPAMRRDMQDLVQTLVTKTGAMAILVSHDPIEAARFADQFIVVADGKAAAPQNAAEVLQSPPEALKSYLL